jgi:ABC-2 type transport system permease protein
MKSNYLNFAFHRLVAVIIKEFTQMKRDKLTFAMMLGIPLIQLVLFGYAVNTDPKNLPTAVSIADESIFSRSVISALDTSGYFKVIKITNQQDELNYLMQTGQVQFIVNIPVNFSEDIVRSKHPKILIEVDATDPTAIANAVAVLDKLVKTALEQDLTGSLAKLKKDNEPFEFIVHKRYNPEGITQYNIVPGLMGVILTMTMMLMTALSVTKEKERGTIENLLSMPVGRIEVMLGKISPYILIGYMQIGIIIIVARYVFEVPILGSVILLVSVALIFIAVNLAIGFTFSILAQSQLQAMQMSFFFFLPSILLSGFMFPFRGMPNWAQFLGEMLPLTHFIRIIRGILLKGSGFKEIITEVVSLLVILAIIMLVALKKHRQTLD